MDRPPGFGIGEADLLALSQDRPKVALVHRALTRPSGLDGGFVHGQHAGLPDALELGRIDGGEE